MDCVWDEAVRANPGASFDGPVVALTALVGRWKLEAVVVTGDVSVFGMHTTDLQRSLRSSGNGSAL
jgi:hypothetical protein